MVTSTLSIFGRYSGTLKARSTMEVSRDIKGEQTPITRSQNSQFNIQSKIRFRFCLGTTIFYKLASHRFNYQIDHLLRKLLLLRHHPQPFKNQLTQIISAKSMDVNDIAKLADGICPWCGGNVIIGTSNGSNVALCRNNASPGECRGFFCINDFQVDFNAGTGVGNSQGTLYFAQLHKGVWRFTQDGQTGVRQGR